jgi:hypothetical protein
MNEGDIIIFELPSSAPLSKSTLQSAMAISITTGIANQSFIHDSMKITIGIKRYPNATVSNTDVGFLEFSISQL